MEITFPDKILLENRFLCVLTIILTYLCEKFLYTLTSLKVFNL
uniref:Uncharacterized protein n=1 Tax=Myoviridae sp. ctkfK18 TaxID=2825165 RepID=A0A8S5VGM4_9CAUD|nr:MAG TPA: hypothetical protein [Myoviridae sp. ctkfK18]